MGVTTETAATLGYLARALKAPTIGRVWEPLAETAREEGWSHEEYLTAVLQRQVADREANGTSLRIAGAHFPAVKTLEDFNVDHQPSLRRDVLAHLATTTWIPKAENVILLGPPGVGKTHLGIALGIRACHAGYPVAFDTASGWASRLQTAHREGRLEHELKRLRRYRLLIIDEVGYLPFDADTANLFFQLIAARYEQGSILVTSNMPFGRWGEIFADDIVASAMIDRLVHHAEVLTLAGDSYRTRARRELLKFQPTLTNRRQKMQTVQRPPAVTWAVSLLPVLAFVQCVGTFGMLLPFGLSNMGSGSSSGYYWFFLFLTLICAICAIASFISIVPLYRGNAVFRKIATATSLTTLLLAVIAVVIGWGPLIQTGVGNLTNQDYWTGGAWAPIVAVAGVLLLAPVVILLPWAGPNSRMFFATRARTES